MYLSAVGVIGEDYIYLLLQRNPLCVLLTLRLYVVDNLSLLFRFGEKLGACAPVLQVQVHC